MAAHLKIVVLTAGILVPWMALALTAAAADSPSVGIAVVDVQYLMQNTTAAKDVRAKLEKRRAEEELRTKSTLDDLKKQYEMIAKERPMLTEEVYQKRVSGLRERAAIYRVDSDKRLRELDVSLGAALQKIAGSIEENVNFITKERKLFLVLPRSGVIGAPAVADITQDVLKRIDQQMPTVAIELSK